MELGDNKASELTEVGRKAFEEVYQQAFKEGSQSVAIGERSVTNKYQLWGSVASEQDKFLYEVGEDEHLFERMKKHPIIFSNLRDRYIAAKKYDWELIPERNGLSVKSVVTDRIRKRLKKIGIKNLLECILSSIETDKSITQKIWEYDKELYPAGWYHSHKKSEWPVYLDRVKQEKEYEFEIINRDQLKRKVDDRIFKKQEKKYIVSQRKDPILITCYWSLRYIIDAERIFAFFMSKASVKPLIAILKAKTQEDAKKWKPLIAKGLSDLVNGGAATLAGVEQVIPLDIAANGGSLFLDFLGYHERKITRVINLQVETSDQNKYGSNAKSQVAYEIKDDQAIDDVEFAEPYIEQIIKEMVEVEFGIDEVAPGFQFRTKRIPPFADYVRAFEAGFEVNGDSLQNRYNFESVEPGKGIKREPNNLPGEFQGR